MKTLFGALVVLASVCPAYADTTILSEDFDGNGGTAPAPGTALTSLGWTGNSGATISSLTIDSGQSADLGVGAAWGNALKSFSHTPTAGETYTLTATLYASSSASSYASIVIANAADFGSDTSELNIRAAFGQYGGFNFRQGDGTGVPQIKFNPTNPTDPMDVKMVLKDDRSDFYYRLNGTGTWTSAGGFDTTLPLSTFNEVVIAGVGSGHPGWIDSISLTSAVPEPTTITLLVTGLLGLLAYAWRKRK